MIYLLDKPNGWTSFDLVKKVRNVVGEKAGHSGTLDPLATGLMIVATGTDTKKLASLIGLDKTYVAEFLLGRQTDTADQEGVVLKEDFEAAGRINDEEIAVAIDNLVGEHLLPVPIYSAVKVNGRPLYWYARNNKSVEIPTRPMMVYASKLISVSDHATGGKLITLELSVASGVYIRSLAEYFGQMIGNVPAMMWQLRRTKIGDYSIDQAQTIDQLTQQ